MEGIFGPEIFATFWLTGVGYAERQVPKEIEFQNGFNWGTGEP